MKQSRLMSFLESTASTVAGFGLGLGAQVLFLPLLGVGALTLTQNLAFAAIMTAVSIARGFVLRRLFEALHLRRPLSPFTQAVIAERFRQIEVEGWTAEHDDAHEAGELARAGASYALCAGFENESMGSDRYPRPPGAWPWSREWWKPAGFRRDLVKAGALIIAEGEKFDRGRKVKPAGADCGASVAPIERPHDVPYSTMPRLMPGELAHGKCPSEQGGASA